MTYASGDNHYGMGQPAGPATADDQRAAAVAMVFQMLSTGRDADLWLVAANVVDALAEAKSAQNSASMGGSDNAPRSTSPAVCAVLDMLEARRGRWAVGSAEEQCLSAYSLVGTAYYYAILNTLNMSAKDCATEAAARLLDALERAAAA